ncbi:CoA transferase [uncultured Roseobacter sp.]|uniref:CaiB/BaiF CoA transferase family protein n=1 Tax=uncultured Roseobacter sp. TaxID=114847 RepID=UPI00262F3887|nr:CoA transferase [uncultured Roseobacter sp.]
MNGPLDGFRILDLTSMISGPMSTMILADQGAEVIKVEHPEGGDHTRLVSGRRGGFSSSFLNNNRNKRSVTLNLKDKDGIAACLKLAARSDVFIQNFRPGVAERIGLGEAAVRGVRSDIVYVSIAGFGFEGPWAGKPVFDPLIQALSGLTTVQGGADDRQPRLVRTILPDKLTAVQASQAVTAALLARARTGKGQTVTLSMLDTVISFLWGSDMSAHTFVGDEPDQDEPQSWIDLIYTTSDGYISVAAMTNKSWESLATALDRTEWLQDPRFATSALRDVHKNLRLELTQEALKDQTTDYWMVRLTEHDVPCARILTRAEMIEHPQVQANGIVIETDHPHSGRLRQARPPARFVGYSDFEPSPAQMLGQETRAVLSEAGFADAEITAMIACGAATDAQEPGE